MNILSIQKFFYLHGGGSRYFFEVSKLLRRHKHKLAFFAMHYERNKSSKWSKYFVNYLSFEKVSLKDGFKLLGRMLYSFEARKKISQLLSMFKPNIIHLYDIYHHISPSILPELKKRKIPVVQTLGDYHFIAPNYNLFHDGRICEITKKNLYYKAILHKCVKDSYLASLAEVIEKYIHFLLGWERDYVDYFLAPSLFMKRKLIEYGLPDEKIIHLPHFVDYRQFEPNFDVGNYILYFGRLSEEKGLSFLLEVIGRLPKVKLKIAGRGPKKEKLKEQIERHGLLNVKLVGFLDGKELKHIIMNSRFTILPSIWFENAPLSILESFVSGKPVIGSNIGGIPELIKDGYNGLLFKPGNVDDLVEKINCLWSNSSKVIKMGKNARECVEKYFSPDDHYEKLMEIYKRTIFRHR